jgi:hypothetical protein
LIARVALAQLAVFVLTGALVAGALYAGSLGLGAAAALGLIALWRLPRVVPLPRWECAQCGWVGEY